MLRPGGVWSVLISLIIVVLHLYSSFLWEFYGDAFQILFTKESRIDLKLVRHYAGSLKNKIKNIKVIIDQKVLKVIKFI